MADRCDSGDGDSGDGRATATATRSQQERLFRCASPPAVRYPHEDFPPAMMSRLTSATFAARAFARCRATYRDICLNRSDIRDWRARPRAARARRRATSLTCRDICLESLVASASFTRLRSRRSRHRSMSLDMSRHLPRF